MKLYSYVIKNNTGFAPNFENGYCTLACCKPVIRRVANVGDWVIGTGSRNIGNNKIIYAMKITEKISFLRYFHDARFKERKDNIYATDENGNWKQIPNKYHKEKHINHDLSGIYVLISDSFNSYNFKNPIPINDELKRILIKKGQGHRICKEENLIKRFESLIQEKISQD